MSEDKKGDKPFFDEEKKQKVIEWIKTKCQELTCECCGKKKWALSEDIVTPMLFSGSIMIGGNVYPSVLAICDNCGNTKFFNVAMMNIFPPPKTKQEVVATKEKKNG